MLVRHGGVGWVGYIIQQDHEYHTSIKTKKRIIVQKAIMSDGEGLMMSRSFFASRAANYKKKKY